MKIALYTTIIFILTTVGVSAQSNGLIFGSTYIPQKNALNPAFYPNNNTFYISLPGFNPELHIPVSYNDLFFREGSSDERFINAWDLAEKLKSNNNLFLNTDIQHIGIGMRFGNLFANFSSMSRLNIHLGVPTGAAEIFANKFEGLADKQITISEPNLFSATAYNEYALGAGYSFGELTVGARLKLLNGICDFRTTQTNFDLTFNSENQLTNALIRYNAMSAGSQIFKKNSFCEVMEAIFSSKNWGMNIDIGATYKWRMLEFSASILDLGKGIHWKNDVVSITPHENTAIIVENYDFGHIAIDNWDTLRSVFRGTLDSIQINDSTSGGDYWSPTPTRLNLGATVQLGKMFRAGILFHGQWDKDISFFDRSGNVKEKTMFRHTTTLVGGVNLANWVELMASLSVVKNGSRADWFNPGVGVNFSFGKIIQLYALVNYVSSLNYKAMKSANVQIGFNLMFGKGLTAKATGNDE